MDQVFRALADPSRRRRLDRLHQRTGQTLRELCAGQEMTRQPVSKHLAVLEAANLVTTVWRGREKLHSLNAAPISDIAGRWTGRYGTARVRAVGPEERAAGHRVPFLRYPAAELSHAPSEPHARPASSSLPARPGSWP